MLLIVFTFSIFLTSFSSGLVCPIVIGVNVVLKSIIIQANIPAYEQLFNQVMYVQEISGHLCIF
jgi:hypothetical protein